METAGCCCLVARSDEVSRGGGAMAVQCSAARGEARAAHHASLSQVNDGSSIGAASSCGHAAVPAAEQTRHNTRGHDTRGVLSCSTKTARWHSAPRTSLQCGAVRQ